MPPEALLFNGGGYTIEVVIGFLDEPVIAQVRFTPPGAKDWASLPRDLLRIEKFDMKKSILIMHFSNKNNPDLPASFSLSANNTRGILSLAAKKLRANSIGTFNGTAKFAPLFERRKMAQSINSHCALITRELRWMYYDQPVIFGWFFIGR